MASRSLFRAWISSKSTTRIYEDNQSCIALSRNPIHHARTKHFDIQHHFVREKCENGDIYLEYCPTDNMLADILTKGLNSVRFTTLRNLLGMSPTHHS